MNTILILAALTVFRVDPWYHKPFLPDADPEGGVVTDAISFAAAKGEIEAVSFVVRPDADYAKVDVVPSDLTGPDGAKIPASAADVTLVKVWFRAGGRWNTSWAGDRTKPEPISGLVLHDDALVKVDWEKKINYVRGDYSDGPTYLDMSHRDLRTRLNTDCEPIRDAAKFVPFDLKKGFRQQYLVTWKIPKDAKPGDYKGTIILSTPDSQLSTLNLSLTVHPFALPRPRTHYDTREKYVSFWMGSPMLERMLAEGHRLDRAERKARAIFRSLVEHNAGDLTWVGDLRRDSTDDYALRTLLIARQEGMSADPFINGLALETWGPPPGTVSKKIEPEDYPEDYQRALAAFRKRVEGQRAIMEKHLGHHRCYYASVDECKEDVNRACYGFWDIVHKLDGMVWTDFAYSKYNGVFVDMNDVPGSVDHGAAWEWHSYGAKSVTYAGTFTGPENPDVWRRNKGIRYWYADFDGVHEYYLYAADVNRWNDFIETGVYCQFGIVFYTVDGLVSTLAWEAVREALDDVRYFTLLRRRAEAALKSSDPETRRLGRAALVWQDGVDPEHVADLDAFRRETTDWIKKLIAKVGPEPEERDTELPPPAELPPDGRWQKVPKASAGAKAVFDYAVTVAGEEGSVHKGEGRYDLALAALGGLLRDASAATPDRVRAALWMSTLHSEMQERPAALAVLEEVLKLGDLTGVDRGRLLLRRVTAMMTNEKFEEKYAVGQLDAASAALTEALNVPGVDGTERATAIRRMTRAYLGAKAYERCIAYAEERLKDTTLAAEHQAHLQIAIGEAASYREDWARALKAYKEAHRLLPRIDVIYWRSVVTAEARAAEKAKDYERAVFCWMEMIPTWDPTESRAIYAAKEQVRRLQPLARKGAKMADPASSDDDSGDTISLDE